MTLGENIKRIRQEKGLTQKQLGNLCNPPMADSAIRRYEAGKANPKTETVLKIAKALGVPVSYLNDSFGWLKEPEYMPLEKKLEQIGYTLGENDDGYLWINYPDGTLEITLDDLSSLESDTDSYLKFKLDELKKKNAKDFRPYKS